MRKRRRKEEEGVSLGFCKSLKRGDKKSCKKERRRMFLMKDTRLTSNWGGNENRKKSMMSGLLREALEAEGTESRIRKAWASGANGSFTSGEF